MADEPSIWVRGNDGLIGALVDTPPFDTGRANVRVRLSDGREVLVPAGSLVRQPDGSYFLGDYAAQGIGRQETVVPVVAEELVVDKRPFATGGVRVHKHVQEREEVVDMPLVKEHVDVRRVVIDRVVDEAPQVRHEGDTTIIPIVEEVLVVQKQLRLKEELHITKSRTEERHQERVSLRREEAEVERVDAEGRRVLEQEPAVEEPPLVLPRVEAPRREVPIRRNKVIRED